MKLGPIIDGLDIESDVIDPGDIVSEAIVLFKIVGPDGRVRLAYAYSAMSWIERHGMLSVAALLDADGLREVNGYGD